jgi:putative ABC transport system permease protein
VAGVVMVFVGVLSIAAGFGRTIRSTGRPDVALVLRSGSDDEMGSALALGDARIIGDAPGILRGEAGPMVSAELYMVVDLPKKSTGTDVSVPLRGVERAAFEVRPDVRIVEGRVFEWGRNEIIVGQAAAAAPAALSRIRSSGPTSASCNRPTDGLARFNPSACAWSLLAPSRSSRTH